MNRIFLTVSAVAVGALATVGAVAIAALRKVDTHVGIGEINDPWGSFNSDIFDENPKDWQTKSESAAKPNTSMTTGVSVSQVAAKKVPAKKVPAKKVPAKRVPVKRVPVKRVPAKKVPAKRVVLKKVPTSGTKNVKE